MLGLVVLSLRRRSGDLLLLGLLIPACLACFWQSMLGVLVPQGPVTMEIKFWTF